MSPIDRTRLFAVLSALLFSLACASKPPAPAPAPQKQPAPVVQTSESNQVAIRQAPPKLDPVYFGTDEATLQFDARELLEGYAKLILDHPEWGVVTIDGHCDERGSDPYNQALGKRRAGAVERYLVKLQVPPARITIRTFGSHRPAALGHDESAWAYNRRSELQVEAPISSASL